jgi:hypothetical protein
MLHIRNRELVKKILNLGVIVEARRREISKEILQIELLLLKTTLKLKELPINKFNRFKRLGTVILRSLVTENH